MDRNGYLFVYLVVFLFSFLGLFEGLTNNWIVDSFLNFIFFLLSYSFILIIYETNREKNIYYSIFISILTLLYFYKLSLFLLIIPIVLIFYLFLIKREKFNFNPINSLFFNFYLNIFFVEKIFFILFLIFILIYNYNKIH